MEYHPLPAKVIEEYTVSKDKGSSLSLSPTPTISPAIPPLSVSPNLDCPDWCRFGTRNYASSLSPRSSFKAFSSLSSSPSSAPFPLSEAQIRQFREDGCLVVKGKDMWTADEMALLKLSADDMNSWPDAPGKYMKYYEKHRETGEKILCRTENFCQYSPGLNYFCNGRKLMDATSALFGCPSILYKEKINYKLPGGAGFVCHQDVAAGWWMYGQSLHISVLVCIDRATIDNGCLEVSKGQHNRGMLCEPWKEITKEVEDSLKFDYLQTELGDVIFFDSYVPHRSAPNNTKDPRRVLYATYAKKHEGDFREKYYYDKRQSYPPDCERLPDKKYEYKV